MSPGGGDKGIREGSEGWTRPSSHFRFRQILPTLKRKTRPTLGGSDPPVLRIRPSLSQGNVPPFRTRTSPPIDPVSNHLGNSGPNPFRVHRVRTSGLRMGSFAHEDDADAPKEAND